LLRMLLQPYGRGIAYTNFQSFSIHKSPAGSYPTGLFFIQTHEKHAN
jgi:hypothetical protein